MLLFFIFLFGLVLGSFLNVVIVRVPNGRGIVRGRSACTKCGHVLAWYDLVPIVSYITLRGRCRYCKKRISPQYPLIELYCGVIAIASFVAWGHIGILFWIFSFSILLVCAALIIIDFRHLLLPDPIVIFLVVAAGIFALASFVSHSPNPFGTFSWQSFVAGGAFAGVFWGLWYFSHGAWLGFGDVKLIGVMGLVFGFPGSLIVAYMAIILGGLIGLILLVTSRGTRKTKLPFGAFLCIAAIIFLFNHRFLLDLVARFLG